jgi:hypothetical protein
MKLVLELKDIREAVREWVEKHHPSAAADIGNFTMTTDWDLNAKVGWTDFTITIEKK